MDVVFSETTFTNDRQKAEVIVTKQDKDTENPLDGGIFGLYSASDITNADGAVAVSYTHLTHQRFSFPLSV